MRLFALVFVVAARPARSNQAELFPCLIASAQELNEPLPILDSECNGIVNSIPGLGRVLLLVAMLSGEALVMYKGYLSVGTGWLLIGWPFALAAGLAISVMIQRTFPPKLEAHAEGNTWLKLT